MGSSTTFVLERQIHKSRHSVVYRGRRKSDMLPVIIKMLRKKKCTADDVKRRIKEYDIIRNLSVEGVITPISMGIFDGLPVLVLEDFGAIDVKNMILRKKFAAVEFVQFALRVTKILGELHRHGIIHNNIKPANIVINPDNKLVKLIDFDLSNDASSKRPAPNKAGAMAGTLPYMSPEQTGRTRHMVDSRSDIYSLGVCFYEILTGRLPFMGQDIGEMIHSHLARVAIEPHKVRKGIPQIITRIVMKMMAKSLEERYQSMYGVHADLATCLRHGRRLESIADMEIGCRDLAPPFQNVKKLYGRDREVKILARSIDSVHTGTKKLVLVTGYSGIGKTSLIKKVLHAGPQTNRTLLYAKGEHLNRKTPYAVLRQAFQGMIRSLLTLDDKNIAIWQRRLKQGLYPNGRLIIDLIPELTYLIGPQKQLPPLPLKAHTNRFKIAFTQFVESLIAPQNPLILFLDDMQWADIPSLQLLVTILHNRSLQHLLVIGAYRNNEVGADHPLRRMIENTVAHRVELTQIDLKPIGLHSVAQLLQDELAAKSADSLNLAAVCVEKTAGNPFYLIQFLQTLSKEHLIRFDAHRNRWVCKIKSIADKPVSENVADLMAGRFYQLPVWTQHLLMLAACIGNQFSLRLLCAVSDLSRNRGRQILQPAITEGFIAPAKDKAPKRHSDPGNESGYLSFVHDRIQQTIYALLKPEHRRGGHLKIGITLLAQSEYRWFGSSVYDIVNHLNLGRSRLTDQQQARKLAFLNFYAGCRARKTSAYILGLIYYRIGIELLGRAGWQNNYRLCLRLHAGAAEMAYLSGKFDLVKDYTKAYLDNARRDGEKITAYEIIFQTLRAQNRHSQVLQYAKKILKPLRIYLPQRPSKIALLFYLLKTKFIFENTHAEELHQLPRMKNTNDTLAIRILGNAVIASYYTNPQISPVIVHKLLVLTIRHGYTPLTPFIFALQGLIFIDILNDIDLGFRFGKMSQIFMGKDAHGEHGGKTQLVWFALIKIWKKHAKSVLRDLLMVHNDCLRRGDIEIALLASNLYYCYCYITGGNLTLLKETMRAYIGSIQKYQHRSIIDIRKLYLQVVHNLTQQGDNPTRIQGDIYDEDQKLPKLIRLKDENSLFHLYFNKMYLSYLYKDMDQALRHSKRCQKHLIAVRGMLLVAVFRFYQALAYLACCRGRSRLVQQVFKKKAARNLRRLRHWARHAPMNHLHKQYLVEAELLRVAGKAQSALKRYDKAIKLANKNGYINEEALACELMASFQLDLNCETAAKFFLDRAIHCYRSWGATGKALQLATEHANLCRKPTSPQISLQRSQGLFDTVTDLNESLIDSSAVIKSIQAISEEIDLDRLLEKMILITMENAGAQRGLLLIEDHGRLYVEAERSVDQSNTQVLQRIPLEKYNTISKSIVNYVSRTHENVVVESPLREKTYFNDAYLSRNKNISILCVPVLYQEELKGLLYLENRLTKGAFNDKRLQIVRIISSQIAISIQNANLYRELKTEIADRKKIEKTRLMLEKQLMQSQKLEALGTLAGGIAHDFNNILSAMTGYIVLVKDKLHKDNQSRKDLELALQSGHRAESLISQILTFSRRAGKKAEPFGLKRVFMEVERFLRSGLPSTTILRTSTRITSDTVYGDQTQIHQLLMNLGTNAMQALEDFKGEIRLSLTDKTVAPEFAKQHAIKTGRYAVINVIDNGCGIKPNHMGRIFDPFFTTKPVNKGTGLGLAAAHGIVKNHSGTITVKSKAGVGTAISIYLPIMESKLPHAKTNGLKTAGSIAPQRGTVMLVDDEQALVHIGKRVLEQCGYKVYATYDVLSAFKYFKINADKIDLVIADQTMPFATGIALAKKMLAIRPQLPIIIVTGYDIERVKQKACDLRIRRFLKKPLDYKRLDLVVQQALHRTTETDKHRVQRRRHAI